MRRRLLAILACPACAGDLTVDARRADGDEIHEGTLACGRCGRTAPVAGGIPRFVAAESYAASFGFEWSRWSRVQLDRFNRGSESARAFTANTGLAGDDVKGRLVLDAGVGAGRYADVVSDWGGEVVGVDLSRAVDVAHANLGDRPNVHLVQADLFALPFRAGTFDVAYSIGVLHHTPDPARAFRCVSATVRKGGVLAVYVYPAYGAARHFSDALRRVTTRLPARLMLALSRAAVPLYPVYRLPVIGRVLQTVLPISLHPDPRWRWLDTFDWYTPAFQFKYRYPEVYAWFAEAGYDGVQMFDEPITMRGRKDG
jgi:SAM-dependent methyltransferase